MCTDRLLKICLKDKKAHQWGKQVQIASFKLWDKYISNQMYIFSSKTSFGI